MVPSWLPLAIAARRPRPCRAALNTSRRLFREPPPERRAISRNRAIIPAVSRTGVFGRCDPVPVYEKRDRLPRYGRGLPVLFGPLARTQERADGGQICETGHPVLRHEQD